MNIFKSNVRNPLISSSISTYLKATSAMARVKLCATLSVGLAALLFTWSCAPSSTAAVAVDNGPFGVADISATFNVPPQNGIITLSGTTITITGFTNARDTSSATGTVTITERSGVFTVAPGSVAIADPTGVASDTNMIVDAFTVTPDGGTATTYTVVTVFAGIPVRELITAASFSATYGSRTPPQDGRITLEGTKIIIDSLFNEANGAAGSLVLVAAALPAGYVSSGLPLAIPDPDGTGVFTNTEAGTITIAEESVDSPANRNSETYTVEVRFLDPAAPFGVADIRATFNSMDAGVGDITLRGTMIAITGFTNARDTLNPRATGTVTITERPSVFTVMPASVAIADPTGVASDTTTMADVFTVTPVGGTATIYTVVIEFAGIPSLVLRVTGTVVAYEQADLAVAAVTVTNGSCQTYEPMFEVAENGVVDRDYASVPSPASSTINYYYDRDTPANNMKTQTVTVTKASASTVFSLTVVIQECALVDPVATTVNGNVDVPAVTGTGTVAIPWNIDNDMKLDLVSRLVNVEFNIYHDDYYELGGNINLGRDNAPWGESAGGEGFVPIATNNRVFSGNFDCKNNTISNLYINSIDATTGSNKGLFGIINSNMAMVSSSTAMVSNCNLVDFNITAYSDAGALVGHLETGILSNNTASRSTETGATSTVTTVGEQNTGGILGGDAAGGLVGSSAANTVITNSSATNVTVKGTTNVGGLVGSNSSDITNSHVMDVNVRGSVNVGNFLGMNGGNTATNYATATTAAAGTPGTVIVTGNKGGGFIGKNSGPVTLSYVSNVAVRVGTEALVMVTSLGGFIGENNANVTTSYASGGSVSGGSTIGGFIGTNVSDTVDRSFTTVAVSTTVPNGAAGGFVGTNTGIISNAYATGNVESVAQTGGDNHIGGFAAVAGTTLTNAYSTGTVTFTSGTGTVHGFAVIGSATDSYWDTVTSGTSGVTTSTVGTGKTTIELQMPMSAAGIYADWDDTDSDGNAIWNFGTASEYPVLNGLSISVADQR